LSIEEEKTIQTGRGRWPDEGFLILETPLDLQPPDILAPFAWDEAICRKIGTGEHAPLAHIWRHKHALVLGLRDSRLPYAGTAIKDLREQGLSVAVRNSGGAAVPLDAGVVNLSLIFPYSGSKMDFHSEFMLLAGLIRGALSGWTGAARTGEVQGAYCPGEYDLSIGGRKFCGIAQRRQLKAYVVSAFIVVEGAGSERGGKAVNYYLQATGGVSHPDDPGVVPETMGSLQELAGVPSAEAFIEALKQELERFGGRRITSGRELLSAEEISAMMDELRKRYEPF
jgi:octanoyl-[GcvH]:protein N-octanoyltransferase